MIPQVRVIRDYIEKFKLEESNRLFQAIQSIIKALSVQEKSKRVRVHNVP